MKPLKKKSRGGFRPTHPPCGNRKKNSHIREKSLVKNVPKILFLYCSTVVLCILVCKCNVQNAGRNK